MNLKSILTSYWFRSAFYSSLQRFSLIFFGFISFFLLIRSLTVQQMSTWALFLTIITLLENTKTALLKNAHIKYVSGNSVENERSAIASSSLLINAGITVLFILLILFAGKQIGLLLNAEQDLFTIFLWFIPGLIAMIFFAHLEAVQQSHFDFKGVFAGNLVRQVVFFSAITFHFFTKKPLQIYLLGIYQSISIIIGTLVIFLFTKKYLHFRFNPSLSWIKTITGYGGYIFGTGVVSNLYSNLDQFMTAAIVPGSVAFYNAAKRINGFIDVPTYAAADIAFPKLSQASANEGLEKIKYLYEKMVAVILSVITPAAIVVIVFAKQIIQLIAGENYLIAAPVLQAYMLISIVGVLQHQAATTLYSVGKTKLCFIVSSISLLLNLAVTFTCLKIFGFYGAAIGSLITAVINTTVWILIMRKEVNFTISSIPVYCRQHYQTGYQYIKNIITKNR